MTWQHKAIKTEVVKGVGKLGNEDVKAVEEMSGRIVNQPLEEKKKCRTWQDWGIHHPAPGQNRPSSKSISSLTDSFCPGHH
ncbi:unnamed protein product [Nezara viridula]|uniref:Uncharacterized protein n=1 Tax=Nezara viridula TaxID=85310 RepID=A0A9P0E6L2_NEZVI|nr:unnamed protein product [Nezara viridula]